MNNRKLGRKQAADLAALDKQFGTCAPKPLRAVPWWRWPTDILDDYLMEIVETEMCQMQGKAVRPAEHQEDRPRWFSRWAAGIGRVLRRLVRWPWSTTGGRRASTMGEREPLPNRGQSDRDERGRFKPGCKPGPGNPLAGEVARNRAKLLKTIKESHVGKAA